MTIQASPDMHPTPVAHESVIVVEEATKVYEPSPLWLRFLLRSAVTSPVTALERVSLTLGRGEICAVVGPNGAGKSTLFRMLTGLTTPTSGKVTVHGINVATASRAAREVIGFVPAGDQTLYLRLTCTENLLFHGRLQGLRSRQLHIRAREALEQVGLATVGGRVGFALSAGMRARLQLARALLHRPRVLILDEPTAAVDPVGSYELLEVIKGVVAHEGVSVLLSSHRLEEIEALHDRVALLDGGRVVYDGDLDTLRRRYQRPVVELKFEDEAKSQQALQTLGCSTNLEILDTESCRISLLTDRTVGSLLRQLGDEVGHVVSVNESRLPLGQLLQDVLSSPESAASRGSAASLKSANGAP